MRTICLLVGSWLILATGCRTVSPHPVEDTSVVAIAGSEVIDLATFEAQYARSVGSRLEAADDSLEAYRDFLERYVNYRLRVQEARTRGYERDAALIAEVEAYRIELARSYLIRREVVEPLLRTLYQRMPDMVDISHIFVRVPPNATPADTLAAYRRLQALLDSIRQGADFNEIAFRHSDDPSARSSPTTRGGWGRIGWIKMGQTIEPMETYAFNTPVGELSPIFRTRFGYHVLKVHARQPAPPDVRAAHIMITPEPTPEDSARAHRLLDSLRLLVLQDKADFAELARRYSEDWRTKNRGGDLGYLSFAQPLPTAVRDTLFSLKKIGDVSHVTSTSFGLHIFQLTDRRPLPPTFEAAYDTLLTVAERLGRLQAARKQFVQRLRQRLSVHLDTARLFQLLQVAAHPDTLALRVRQRKLGALNLYQTFATIEDSTYTLADFVAYVNQHNLLRRTARRDTIARERLLRAVNRFLDDRLLNYEALRRAAADPEFQRTMRHFVDGLLAFKLLEEAVWKASERDTAGLRAYYEAHASEFVFPERTRVLSFRSPHDSTLVQRVYEPLQRGVPVAQLIAELTSDTSANVTIDTVHIARPTGSIYDRVLHLEAGRYTEPFRSGNGYLLLYHDGREPPRLKTFQEARADVLSAYQKVLEARLDRALRARYGVRLFPERLRQAFAAERRILTNTHQ
ncbi:peptidylprolyl isomerase [Rhodothermus profundi]|uniref:Peptidyl-prolyl cis-trans isomerase SurA n=1 Tax=Rhodothermus profundi TaxID=633813 RepID=A0A1M6SHE0_9BACT|nr:peptidylprolyl isomerase [Rhodothermus profundi]SHK44174.1 peptidyl-prolyl cis-trans isomerase SurA [Rhodothermus profundi]